MQTKSNNEELMKSLQVADEVYDAVMSNLDFNHDDEIHGVMVYGLLKRQTRDFIVLTIWKNMTEKQVDHFKDFLNQSAVIAPGILHEEILMEFVSLYPELVKKVIAGLGDFFKDFVEKFNRYGE